jgi:predicted ATPase
MEKLTQNVGEHSTTAYSSKPLIARIGEWGNLLSAWKQAIVSKNALMILKGEVGIGKTRLALEFQAWAESQGDQTVFAACYQSLRSLSYTPVITWLRGLPFPQLNPIWLSELARLLPELLVIYPDLPKPNAIQENWQLNHWYEAIERMLLETQPLLLILDDIQWSDGETLQLISYLLRSDSKARLLVIATMRTDENLGDAVEHFISGLRIERKLTEIELVPLSEEETNRLMVETVGDALAERHSLGLYAKTGGNPLFILETLREWQTGNGKSEFRLTQLAKTVIENRLNKLSPDNRQLVSTFAAIGRPVTTAFMAMVSNLGEEEILE